MLGVSPTVAADGTGGARVYVAEPGDTLWLIGRRTGTDPAPLAVRNQIADARHLRPGKRLLLRRYLDLFSDPRLALAAYYQGEKATRMYGTFRSSRDYVEGIWALRNQLEAST